MNQGKIGRYSKVLFFVVSFLSVTGVILFDYSSDGFREEAVSVIEDIFVPDDLYGDTEVMKNQKGKNQKRVPIHMEGVEVEIDFDEVFDTEWKLGESLNVSYDFDPHYILEETWYPWDVETGDSYYETNRWHGMSSTYAVDSEELRIGTIDDDDDEYLWINIGFAISALTSGTLEYYFKNTGYYDGTAHYSIFSGSYSVSESQIDADGRISLSISMYCDGASADTVDFWFYLGDTSVRSNQWTGIGVDVTSMGAMVDKIKFVQDEVVSQIRSESRQIEGSNQLQKRLIIPNHEYQSQISFDLGNADVDTVEINPSASTSLSGTVLTISDTIPTDYEVTWLSSDDLRLIPATSVNSQVLYGSDFESGNEDWNITGMTFDSAGPESGVVFSGNLAYNFTDGDGNNDTITNEGSLAPNGTYFFNLEHYNVEFSGTGLVLSYYNESWVDLSLNTTEGVWVQEFFEIEISGNDSDANMRIRFHNASGSVIFDSFDFLVTNIIPMTSGFDETSFYVQWRNFDGRNNPIAPERWVDLELRKYLSDDLIHKWDFELTDEHGVAEFSWYARLYEETYNVTSSYWDTVSAPVFNNGSVIFTPFTVSQGGYSWEFYSGEDRGFEVLPMARSSPPSVLGETASALNPINEQSVDLDPLDGDYQEILESRGQTYRHFYNLSSEEYTYQSDYLVRKTNLNPRTDWVTSDEYPVRFVVRNDGGSTVFCTEDELITLFNSFDNSSLWGIGIEGFSGVMAFYTNFEDATNGNGQILWYQRLLNGSLPRYSFPMFQIYDHVYVNFSGTLYDRFFVPTSTVRDRIVVENGSDYLSISYSFQQVYLGRTFQIRRGFKYNRTEHLFHNINHFRCVDASFDDLGIAYEIDATDMSRSSPYRPEKFVLYNANETDFLNETKVVDLSTAWDAGHYFDDFYSQVAIVSENGEEWRFSFEDMEEAGFMEKYLGLHDQLMPDSSTRRILRAGMYGRTYSVGEIVEVDPIFSAKQTTDSRDWFIWYDHDDTIYTGRDDSTALEVGPSGSAQIVSRSGITWDTGITTTIASLSDGEFSFYIYTEYMEATDYAGFGLYDKTSDADEYWSEAEMMAAVSTAYTQSMYYSNPSFFSDLGTGNKTFSGTNTDNLLAAWLSHHNAAPSSRQYLPLKLYEGTGMGGPGTQDVWRARESSYATASYRPTLSFTYTVNTAPNAPTLNQAHGDTYAGKSFSFITDHTDDDGAADIDSMHIWFDTSEYDFSMHCHEGTSSGSVTIDSGSGYLIGTPTYSYSSITDGKRVTWTITIDWDYTWNYYITTKGKTIDDSAADSGWATLDTNDQHFPRLEVTSFSVEIDPAYDEDHDGLVEDYQWFRGGFLCNGSGGTGSVQYYDSAMNFDSSYAATVEIQLFFDDVDLGSSYRDLTIVNGAFSIPSYTPTNSPTQASAHFDVEIQGIPSGGSDQTQSSIKIFSTRDNLAPVDAVLAHSDSDSGGDGQSPEDGYDDDLVMGYTLSGASDGTGVGLATNPYSYRWNSGSWGAWNASTSVSPTSSHGTTADCDVKVRDDLGNEATFDGEDVMCDTSNPDQVTVLQCRPDSYTDSGEYDNDTLIFFTWSLVSDTGSGISDYLAEIGDVSPDEPAGTDGEDNDIGSEGPNTYYIRAVDFAGNCGVVNSDTITIDLTDPILDGAVFTDDGYTPNWYDQGAVATAEIQVSWTEVNPSQVWIVVSGIDTYTDNSPTGGTSTFQIAITGETDGTYDISFYISDLATWSDNDETGTFGDAPLKLDNSGPTDYTIVMASGAFYADKTNDMTPTITASGATDGSGSGLHDSTPYYFVWRVNAGDWNGFVYDADGVWNPSLSTDSSNYDFMVKVRDNLGNFGSYVADNTNTIEDDAPTGLSVYQITEDTLPQYLYVSGSTIHYSNMGSGDRKFTVYVEASDGLSGLEQAVYPATVSSGGTDSTEAGLDYEYIWQYTADGVAESFNGTVSVTVYDQCNNTATVSFDVVLDDVNPSISISGESESSVYLWSEYGTSVQGVYGSQMSSTETFTITGTASDSSSGMLSLTDNTTFGDDPGNGGSMASWSYAYQIDSDDDGNITVRYTATDNVGNINTVDYFFYEDNTDPETVFNYLMENVASIYQYCSGQTYYFSDNMGASNVYFKIYVIPSDNTGNDGVFCVTYSEWGDEKVEVNVTNWPHVGWYETDETETSGQITAFARDQVGNYDTTPVIITCIEDLVSPPAVTDAQARPDGYGDSGEYDNDTEIYFTWTNSTDGSSGIYTHYAEIGDNTPDEDAGNDEQDIDTAESVGVIRYYIYAMDNVGNNGTVAYDAIIVDTVSRIGLEYYTVLVSNGTIVNFTKSLYGIDWRLYRDASIYLYWNGSENLEISVFWRDSNIANWKSCYFAGWRRITFDFTGSLGSENYRGEDGIFGFRFRNPNGNNTDTATIKWTRLEYKTFEAASSDWSWSQPDYFDGWTNGTNSIADVGNSIIRVNSTSNGTDLLIYYNETVESGEYDWISIECRASNSTTLQFMNGSNYVIAQFSVTQSWNQYLIELNSNWSGTQTDLILVWQNSSEYQWFEVNWIVQLQNTESTAKVSGEFLKLRSANNTLVTRVRIDGVLVGDYQDLEDIPLNTTVGLHHVECIAWDDISYYSVYLHSRAYYFTYEIEEEVDYKVYFQFADAAGLGYDFNTLKLYVNGSLWHYSEMTVDDDTVLNLEVKDYFDYSLRTRTVTITNETAVVFNIDIYFLSLFNDNKDRDSFVVLYRLKSDGDDFSDEGMYFHVPRASKNARGELIHRFTEGDYRYECFYSDDVKLETTDTKNTTVEKIGTAFKTGAFTMSTRLKELGKSVSIDATPPDKPKTLVENLRNVMDAFWETVTDPKIWALVLATGMIAYVWRAKVLEGIDQRIDLPGKVNKTIGRGLDVLTLRKPREEASKRKPRLPFRRNGRKADRL